MNRPTLFFVLVLCISLGQIPFGSADHAGSLSHNLGFGPSYVKDTIPDRLEPGRTYPIALTFKNTGLVSWESKTHRVGLVYYGNLVEVVALPSFVEIPAKAIVQPGHDVSFGISILPVGVPATYTISFGVVYRSAQGDNLVTEIFEKKVTIVPSDGVSSPLYGSIVVESQLENIEIYLDGVSMGQAPCIIPDLTPGRYDVEVKGGLVVRSIPVQVGKGTLSRVYIDNLFAEPRIISKKVGFVSDGTLIGYIESNIPLVILVVAFILFCVGLMVHAVRLRRESETDKKDTGNKKRFEKKDTDDPAEQEKDLLDKIHGSSPRFDAESPASDIDSGSSVQEMKIHNLSGGMKNVRNFSREMLDVNLKKTGGGTFAVGGGAQAGSPADDGGVEISLKGFEVHPGFGRAHVSAQNHSTEPLTIEGHHVGPGSVAIIPVEVAEPSTEEYEVNISLKILSDIGNSFYHQLQIPYNRGIALFARGVYEKAYDYYQEIARKNPRHIDALLKKASILFEWGLEEECSAVIDQILAVNPNHEDALHLLEKIQTLNREKKKLAVIEGERRKIPGFPESMYDRYTPIRLLGEDPFASIILAIRIDTGDLRALKIAHTNVDVGSGLYTEISVLYQLRHLNVLKMYRAEFNPNLFLELEYASGVNCGEGICRTLADLNPPISDDVMIPMIEGIASGVAYIHSKGVRHYHLSPKYIILDEPMTPKISGFIRSSLIENTAKFEADPLIILAPEQIDHDKFGKQGKKTDLFQMGAIWYWLMTGHMPYGGHPVSDEEGRKVMGVYLPVSILRPQYSVYDPLVKRLLALDKRERYDSASEFLAELRGVQLFEKAEEKVTEK